MGRNRKESDVPLYEYECKDCHARFEKLVFNRDAAIRCDKCGGDQVNQLLSVFAVSGGADNAAVEKGPCDSCGAAQRGMCGLN
jgi:putative FmdB family regulatory protein